jgi:hypothetical protein
MGPVANQVCSLRGGGEHANPAKLFEMVGFPVSPPVNYSPARPRLILSAWSTRRIVAASRLPRRFRSRSLNDELAEGLRVSGG